MQKTLLGVALLALSLAFTCVGARAQTDLTFQSGTGPGSTVDFPMPGPLNIQIAIGLPDGWFVDIEEGYTQSPSIGLGLITSFATCDTSSCENTPLNITLTGTGFTQTTSGFQSTYEVDAVTGNGSTAQQALLGATPIGGPIVFSGPISPIVIGSTSGGGPAGPGAYTLTIQDTYDANGGFASFETFGEISAPTPEPTSLLLMGTGLLAMGGLLRRRLRLL